MSILAAHNLAREFSGRYVVRGVDLTVRSGEVVGLLGPNGAGKTTSFYMIAGLVACTTGSIHLDNHDLTHMSMDQRARMGLGYLPQEPSVFRKLSVSDNIMAVLEVREDASGIDRDALLDELLNDFRISHLADDLGQTLSGGERRRVEIARALASNPAFLLLDEPFAGVDPISILDIQRIIEQLADRDIGILITDHNFRETLGICDRAYIVNDGVLIADGKPEQVLADERVREVYLGEQFSL